MGTGLWGTCGLVETCRSHNPKVVSSSPAATNMLWTCANHYTFFGLLTRVMFGTLLGGMLPSIIGVDKLCVGGLAARLNGAKWLWGFPDGSGNNKWPVLWAFWLTVEKALYKTGYYYYYIMGDHFAYRKMKYCSYYRAITAWHTVTDCTMSCMLCPSVHTQSVSSKHSIVCAKRQWCPLCCYNFYYK